MSLSTYIAFFFCACRSCFFWPQALRSIAGSTVRSIVQVCFWLALLGGHPRDAEFIQMLSYMLIITFFNTMISFKRQSWSEPYDESKIALSAIRPYSFQTAFHSTLLGANVGRFITVSLPVIILFGCLFGIPLPADFSHGALSFLQAIAGLLLTNQLLFLFASVPRLFRSVPRPGLATGFQTALLVFGGTMIPIWHYPDFLQRICMFLPFRFCVMEAVYGYIGRISVAQGFLGLAVTLFWISSLHLAGQAICRGVEQRVTRKGG